MGPEQLTLAGGLIATGSGGLLALLGLVAFAVSVARHGGRPLRRDNIQTIMARVGVALLAVAAVGSGLAVAGLIITGV